VDKRELQELLSQSYKQENWKKIVQFVFPNVSILSTPKEFPISNDKIKTFRQLGNVRLNDGKNLALFELLLSDSVNIHRNRVELNNEISKYIDQEQIHGVLSVFEQGTDDYRFTFSARSTEFDEQESNFIQKKTDTKRYTYVLGKNESCKTPAERFFKLSEKKSEVDINAIQNAFSVEQLSKEFFEKYKKQFEKFWNYIHSKETYNSIIFGTDREKGIRDFTKKLLGRIVFLHFLQKKGWMGCTSGIKEWEDGDKQFMQTLFENYSNQSEFHSKCLAELFYNTLNKKRVGELFTCDGLEGILNNSKVPYLNGGLFDSDEDITCKIDFPTSYFQELFDFFGQYNFTIDENDPNDHEVGIDPEMLGHIFENLLEDNKDKGAFYTPKVIVQYMCQESIIEYINTKINEVENTDVKSAIEDLIRNKLAEKCSDLDLVQTISKALFEVKICDPAIGSGAFPMGILNVIYQAIEELYFIQPDSVSTIWKISDTEWQPHLIKKNIIQHSIYGVDLESGAVDIARLRFWLALVVDEIEPLPLPNLDYKIMQGNSLLESFEGIDLSQISDASAYQEVYESEQIDMFSGEAKKSVKISLNFEDVKSLMDDYFNANDQDTKRDLHKRIDDQVLNHIRYTLSQHKQVLTKKANTLIKKIEIDESAVKTWQQKENIRNLSKSAKELAIIKAELELFNKKEIKLAQLSNSNERPFFLWHLFFKEVFDDGGFDIVIGNPPYINLESNTKLSEELEICHFETFAKRGDIYCIFYEQGVKQLKKEGVLTYITSNKWMAAAYGKKTRRFLLDKSNPIMLLDFKETLLFESATVFTNILITKKESNLNNLKSCILDKKYKVKNSIIDYFNTNNVKTSDLDDDIWVISGKASIDINKKIEMKSNSIKELEIFVSRGQTTGCNDAFIINETTKSDLIKKNNKNAERIKPILRGRQITKYSHNFDGDYLIISPYKMHKNLINDYEDLYTHLSAYNNILTARGQVLNGQHHWLELDNNPTLDALLNYDKPKIIWKEISADSSFSFDDEGYYLPNTSYFLIGDDLHFLLGVLNSIVSDFYFFQITPQIAGGSKRYTKQYVEMLRIPNIDYSNKHEISELSKKIVAAKKKKQDIEKFQNQIDELLFDFFEFNEDEKKLIVSSIKKSN
jgi:hypothetical protein